MFPEYSRKSDLIKLQNEMQNHITENVDMWNFRGGEKNMERLQLLGHLN